MIMQRKLDWFRIQWQYLMSDDHKGAQEFHHNVVQDTLFPGGESNLVLLNVSES
jgi:hypothetical protein